MALPFTSEIYSDGLHKNRELELGTGFLTSPLGEQNIDSISVFTQVESVPSVRTVVCKYFNFASLVAELL